MTSITGETYHTNQKENENNLLDKYISPSLNKNKNINVATFLFPMITTCTYLLGNGVAFSWLVRANVGLGVEG